jgi:hypothetical protein
MLPPKSSPRVKTLKTNENTGFGKYVLDSQAESATDTAAWKCRQPPDGA